MRTQKNKVVLAVLALIASVFMLAACGTSRGSSSGKNPSTMVGQWKQVHANSSGWMTASISGNSIQVNLQSPDSNSIFWLGTFDSNKKPRGKFKVISIGDQDAMRWDITASSEAQKTFAYDNGVLSFEFSAMGSSTTIHMVKVKTIVPTWRATKTPSYNRPSPQKSKTPTSRTTLKPTVKKTAPPKKASSTKK